jgi:hypothetical protein
LGYSQGFPGGSLLTAIEQDLVNVDPALNFTGVTYAELVTDFSALYSNFITWYNTYFGPNGLI